MVTRYFSVVARFSVLCSVVPGTFIHPKVSATLAHVLLLPFGLVLFLPSFDFDVARC